MLWTNKEIRKNTIKYITVSKHKERTIKLHRSYTNLQVIIKSTCRVNARSFEPYLYHYGLKCNDYKGKVYTGCLGKTPLLSSEPLIPEIDIGIRDMAEEITRTILELIENKKKLIVVELTLVFAMEKANEPQLWFLGTSVFRFISKEKQNVRTKRVNLTSGDKSLTFSPRKLTHYLPVTTKLPPALRKVGRTYLSTKREKHLSFINETTGRLKKAALDMKAKEESSSQATKKLLFKAKPNIIQTKYYTKSFKAKMNELLSKSYNQFKFFKDSGFEATCNYSTIYRNLIELQRPSHIKDKSIPLNSSSINCNEEQTYIKQNNSSTSTYSPLHQKRTPCSGDFCKPCYNTNAYYPIDQLLIDLGKIKPFSIQGIVPRDIFPLKAEYSKSKAYVERDIARSNKEITENILLERVSKSLREQMVSNTNWRASFPQISIRDNKVVYICRECKIVYTKIARTIGKHLLDKSH